MSGVEDRSHLLVYGLAVGRVKKDAKLADWKKEDQVVLASNLPKDDSSELIQTLRTHFKSILRRGAPRFKGGKRIRLKSGAAKDKENEETSKSEKEISRSKSKAEQRADDEREALTDANIPKYEVHLLAYSIVDDDEDNNENDTNTAEKEEENESRASRRRKERERQKEPENPEEIELKKLARAEKRLIILMAATSVDFPKYHRIAELIRDFKNGFLNVMENLPPETMWNSKPGGSIQRSLNAVFDDLMRRYSFSELKTTEVKVEQVKEAIGESVRKALTAVEKLEDMDEKSVTFEDKAKQFEKKSRQMKTLQKKKLLCDYRIIGRPCYWHSSILHHSCSNIRQWKLSTQLNAHLHTHQFIIFLNRREWTMSLNSVAFLRLSVLLSACLCF